MDEMVYRYGFFFNHDQLTSEGRARARGVELLVQKKLARGVYGLATASYSKTEYEAGDGVWRDRVYDNRWTASLEGGYKPSNRWEFSMRWIFAGGPPYTPLDLEASAAAGRDVLDGSRINEARYPAYHSLNLRFDRRFQFQASNLVWYVSVWNDYNRKNIRRLHLERGQGPDGHVVPVGAAAHLRVGVGVLSGGVVTSPPGGPTTAPSGR